MFYTFVILSLKEIIYWVWLISIFKRTLLIFKGYELTINNIIYKELYFLTNLLNQMEFGFCYLVYNGNTSFTQLELKQSNINSTEAITQRKYRFPYSRYIFVRALPYVGFINKLKLNQYEKNCFFPPPFK
jgi:hypothetical protein